MNPRPSPRLFNSRTGLALAAAALLATAASAAPPEGSAYTLPQPAFFGQVRPRTELDHKGLYDTSSNKTLMSTHLRTRLGFTATPSLAVQLKVELQDTRVFGSEPGSPPHAASVGNRQGVDLLQGYIAVTEGPVTTVLGRQKMQLGAGRYLSTLEWHPYSRAFDGLSANWSMENADLTAFTFVVSDSAATAVGDRLVLSGLHYNRQMSENLTVEVSGFHDQSRLRTAYSGDSSTRYDLLVLGQRVVGKAGMFTYEEEFMYQAGKIHYAGKSKNSAAWQLGLRAGVALPKLKANIGVDAMSGDDDATDDKNTMWRANYNFGHAYFGWMDYFLANPRFGVIDYRADVSAPVWKGETRSATLLAQYHYFTPQNAPSGADKPYGQEVDAELHLSLYPRSNIVLGAGVFLPGDNASRLPAAKLAAGQKDGPGYFLYFMPVFNF
jgi:Alginate export